MTTVERFDTASGTWEPLTYGDWAIEHGVSDLQVAPTATVDTQRTEPVTSGERLRIQENGANIFIGDVTKTKPRTRGPMRVEAEHDAHRLFGERVTINVTGTDEDVLNAALSAASGTWTLAYAGTGTTLGETYDADGRTLKRVFRDMVDRVGRVWWVDIDHTIHVEPYGAQGLLAAVDTSTDDAAVSEYTPDDTSTVVNDVTVIGTGDVAVTGTATDATSINTYGRRPIEVNVEYITGQSEADAYASALLRPDPSASATARVAASVAAVEQPVVNADLDVTDTGGTGMDERLPIEAQTITQGSAELDLGEGAGVNVAQFNRQQKSDDDRTAAGSVMDTDRIDELAITETKISDNSISTPKLQANSITANEIDVLDLDTGELTIGGNTSSGFEFQRVETAPGTGVYVTKMVSTGSGSVFSSIGTELAPIGSVYLNGGTIGSFGPTADNADIIGSSGSAYDEIWAYDFFDADTGTALSDGGDPLAGLAEGRGPPAWATRTDDDGAKVGVSINGLAKGLADICRAQQRVIEDLEARVAELEDPNA